MFHFFGFGELIFKKNIQEYFLNSFPGIIFSLITLANFPKFDWIIGIPFISINFISLIISFFGSGHLL
jgi:hypothetical protein